MSEEDERQKGFDPKEYEYDPPFDDDDGAENEDNE
jgi:hypothetical protein